MSSISAGPFRNRAWLGNSPTWTIAILLLLSFLAGAPSLQAQQDRREQADPSDLGRENLGRVAASAGQIGEILSHDPGLMVELKRWVAKEATDHGQILNDWDLTDQAILDRLANDTGFRSVATRLLQRYGYLVPQLNPNSQVGKEQQLLLQERVERLARAHARAKNDEDEPLTRTRSQEDLGRPRSCDPETDPDCTTENHRPLGRRRDQAGVGSPKDESDGLDLRSTPLGFPGLASESTDQSSPQMIPRGTENEKIISKRKMMEAKESSSPATDLNGGDADSVPALQSETEGTGVISPREFQAESEDRVLPRHATTGGRPERERAEAGLAETAMVRRPNPFADVPSLYDLYMQASSQAPQLQRFGQDVFRDDARNSEFIPMDLPVGPDYVLGPGDGLAIDVWGSVSERINRTVDREGRLALPEVGPILVSGRSLGEVQQTVQQDFRTLYRDISADVSLSRLRTIRVYVVGDVEHPGAYDISSLSTPLNAMFVAGGPTSRGSLRILQHLRGKDLVQEVDVYDLLLRGVKSDLKQLQNGDTVRVPPISAEVTVEGMVRRPSIYELKGEKTLAEVLELAGGILPAATLRHIEVQRLEAHEKRTMLSLDITETQDPEAVQKQLEGFSVQNDDVVHIFPIAPFNRDAVYLQGHVLRPGRYSYHPGMKLTDVVSSYADVLPEPASKYAEIVRLNPPDFRPSVESFDLAAALANPAAAPALQPLDTVRIFSRYNFENPPAVSIGGEVRNPGTYRTSGQIHLTDAIHLAGGVLPDALLGDAQIYRYLPDSKLKIMNVDLKEALAGNPIDNIMLDPRDRILVHRNLAKVDPPSVSIRGEVARPGRYPLTTNLRVSDLIHVAGGLKRSADPSEADLTHYIPKDPKQQIGEHEEISIAAASSGDTSQDALLRDGDVLTIRQVPHWNDIGASIQVQGEVQHPGTYGIRPGERLSSIMLRAGGFLPTAYPQGAVLGRQEVRDIQQKSKEELIQRIEQDAANYKISVSATAQDQAALQLASVQQHQRAAEALRAAPVTGRLVIKLGSNLKQLENSPDDVELRNGDSLYIPKRPNFVIIVGQVYNPNAINFIPGRSAGWYLQRAGGPTDLAEKKAIFIIRANGSVVTGKGNGWWGGDVLSARIEAGDSIVIPEKAIGGSSGWKNMLSLAQVAQSAAFVGLLATR
jgi:polysaccharide biosynthesis/export protein